MAITITESGRLVVTIGRRGVPGVGVIAGGTTGQVLSKASATDYDMEWSAAGSGDMASAVYDPTSVAGDAFDMENMAEGATNKILSSAERTQLTALTGAAGGTTGQIATKASGDDYDLTWADDLTVPGLLTADHIHGNIAGTLYIHVKNTSGGTLAKGTPVYVTGHVGSSDRVEVAAADQSDPAKMPAIALLADELADNGEGDGVIVGEIRTFDTDSPGYALNDELFVGTGALTDTKPTSGAVQPVATVGRLQASTGVLVINCQGQRSPDETFATAAQGSLADSALQSADIDTLAELNAIITDATLIDTTDSRLSDARTPTAHSHTLSDITDAGTAAASNTGDFEASGAVSTHAAITSGVHGISTFGASLIDDADAATARTTLGVDAAGTDNSTDVTLAGSLDYLSLSGQEITLGSVDLTTDVTGTLPAANGGTGVTALTSLNLNTLGSGAATDGYVATADGAGGVAWEAASGGGGGNWTDVSTNAVELRDGITPCEAYIYNTYTDASNYERGFLKWDTNEFVIGTEALGTGTARNLRLITNTEFRVGNSADDDEFLRIDSENVVAGTNALQGGVRNVVLGTNAYVSGSFNSNVVLGKDASSLNHQAIAIGQGAQATNRGSMAFGYNAKTNRDYEFTLARHHNNRWRKVGIWQGLVKCTDASATVFTTASEEANPFPISANTNVAFHGIVNAQISDGSENAAWTVEGIIKRDGSNNTTLIASSVSVIGDDNSTSWSLAIAANDISETLEFTLTAEADVKGSLMVNFSEISTNDI